MKRTLLALACALLAATSAAAAPYSVAAHTNDLSIVVDRSRLQRTGAIVKGDAQIIFQKTQADGVDSGLATQEWDCAGSQYRTMYEAQYNSKSDMIGSQLGDKVWRPAPPGTLVGDLVKAVCSTSGDPAAVLKTSDIPTVTEPLAAARAYVAAHPKH